MMQRPVRDMLKNASQRMSLHMPASQGEAPFEPIDPYMLETTELSVTDDLFNPAGGIAQAERLIAQSANVQSSFMLHGGSTAGIHAMILYACKRGDTIILPRNVHLSALHICAIAGIDVAFADVTATKGWVYTLPEAYQKALLDNPQAVAVFVLSTDYFGRLANVKEIADIAHRYGKTVLCDEAHGAYFNWRTDIQNAGHYGADLFVQSAHKTLPAINAGAWLHACEPIDSQRLRDILRMVQTSSPSFVTMQALDDARAWMDAYGADACSRLLDAMERFRIQAAKLGFTDDQTGGLFDRLRLTLRSEFGGYQLEQILRAHDIDVEMCDTDHVVCILSLLDGEQRLAKLLSVLETIRKEEVATGIEQQSIRLFPQIWADRKMTLSDAAFAAYETLPYHQAIGRISAAYVAIYPPSVAWLTPGDLITAEIADMISKTPTNRIVGANGGIRCVK